MGLLAEQSFKLCTVLIIVCSAAENKRVTIARRLGKSDEFSFAKSINEGELPTRCTTFGGNPLVASEPMKDCTCKTKRETFGYFDNKWRCIDHDEYFARNISGSKSCKLKLNGERLAVVKGDIWSFVRLWSYHDGNCEIDWKGSSMLQCHNSLTPLSKNPLFDFHTNKHQYLLKVKNIPREIHGRVIKLAIRCRSDRRSSHHCLMLKMEGELKCALKPVTESTTPISTTSLLSLTATTETEVTTRLTTTRVAVKNKKRAGSRNNVPLAAVAGGVAAAVILVAVLIVCLILGQKNKRKNGESFTQGGQLEQPEHEPTERKYCLVRNKKPSLVGSRDSPVYERVLNRDSNSEDQTNDGRISPSIQFSKNPEYDCVRTAETERSNHENEDEKLLSSEHYDYAKPEGPPETENTDQNGWYDVPECEIGTLKTLQGQNYYDVAGSIIPGEKTHLSSYPGQQDENDGVTVNPLYGAF